MKSIDTITTVTTVARYSKKEYLVVIGLRQLIGEERFIKLLKRGVSNPETINNEINLLLSEKRPSEIGDFVDAIVGFHAQVDESEPELGEEDEWDEYDEYDEDECDDGYDWSIPLVKLSSDDIRRILEIARSESFVEWRRREDSEKRVVHEILQQGLPQPNVGESGCEYRKRVTRYFSEKYPLSILSRLPVGFIPPIEKAEKIVKKFRDELFDDTVNEIVRRCNGEDLSFQEVERNFLKALDEAPDIASREDLMIAALNRGVRFPLAVARNNHCRHIIKPTPDDVAHLSGEFFLREWLFNDNSFAKEAIKAKFPCKQDECRVISLGGKMYNDWYVIRDDGIPTKVRFITKDGDDDDFSIDQKQPYKVYTRGCVYNQKMVVRIAKANYGRVDLRFITKRFFTALKVLKNHVAGNSYVDPRVANDFRWDCDSGKPMLTSALEVDADMEGLIAHLRAMRIVGRVDAGALPEGAEWVSCSIHQDDEGNFLLNKEGRPVAIFLMEGECYDDKVARHNILEEIGRRKFIGFVEKGSSMILKKGGRGVVFSDRGPVVVPGAGA